MEYYHISRTPLILETVIHPAYFEKLLGNLNNFEFHNQYLKEMIFEEIREKHYPKKASRLNSIFCFANIDSAIEYKEKHEYVRNGHIYQIKLIGNSKMSIYDMKWLNCSFSTYEDTKRFAHSYFSGETTESPELEILVEGLASISNEY